MTEDVARNQHLISDRRRRGASCTCLPSASTGARGVRPPAAAAMMYARQQQQAPGPPSSSVAAVSSGAHHGGHVSSSVSATVHAPSVVPAASYGGGVMGISATGHTPGITQLTAALLL